MDGFRHHHPKFMGPYSGTTMNHLPGSPVLHHSESSLQGNPSPTSASDAVETIHLRTKISTLEYFLAEGQKEKLELQNVITYLLRQNAQATARLDSNEPCKAYHAPCNANCQVTGGEIKDIWIAIAGIAHQISALSHPLSRRPLEPSCNVICGDLLGSLDETPTPQVQDGKANQNEPECFLTQQPKHSGKLACYGLRDEDNAARIRESSKQTANVQDQIPPLDVDAFPRGPYIRRFEQAHVPLAVGLTKSERVGSKRVESFRSEQLKSLGSSFTESTSGFGVSTHHTSQDISSSGLTSIDSSFNDSDIDDKQPASRKAYSEGDEFSVEAGHTLGALRSRQGSSLGTSEDHSGEAISTLPHGASSAMAGLFLPRWPPRPFTITADERERAILVHQKVASDEEHKFPDLFRYGIRFCPDPAEANIYRTVVIDHLPSDIGISVLLRQIRGGGVVDVKLLDTTSITGYATAIIEFIHEHGARSLERRASRVPLLFAGTQARVTVLPTPTWPMCPGTRAAIMEHGHTRCLEMYNPPQSLTPAELKRDLRVYVAMPTSHRIENLEKRANGVVEIRFTSINHAGRAYALLTNFKKYRQCRIKRSPDPCAQAWKEVPKQAESALRPAATIKKDVYDGSNASNAVPWRDFALSKIMESPSPKSTVRDFLVLNERVGRLGGVEFDEVPKIQRGRGFSFEQPAAELKEPCNQQ
ncbi:MAG: hypothetical protein Q9218_005410 [Villophora microphyllina]